MSDNDINLSLEKRQTVRKGLNNVRNSGLVPAVIHNPGKDSLNVQGKYLEVLRAYQNAGKHNPVNVNLDGEELLTMIKQVDFEPKKHTLRHVVFGAIKKGQKVKAEVPVEIVHGEEQIPAERDGLLVIKVVDSLEVEAVPDKLVDKLTVDASSLAEVGDKLHVSDIKVPEGVSILLGEDEEDRTIVTVEAPRAAVEEEAESDEGEGEEGEEGSEENSESEAGEDEKGEEKPGNSENN